MTNDYFCKRRPITGMLPFLPHLDLGDTPGARGKPEFI